MFLVLELAKHSSFLLSFLYICSTVLFRDSEMEFGRTSQYLSHSFPSYHYFNFNFNLLFKWQICYTESKNLLPYTMNAQKFHCQPQCTLELMCKNCVLFELTFTLLYAGSSIQSESEWFISRIRLSFVNLVLHSTPQTKANIVRSGDSNSSSLVTIQN